MGFNFRNRSIFSLGLALAGVFWELLVPLGTWAHPENVQREAAPRRGIEAIFETLLQRSYWRAIEDAREAEETDIDHDLWAIDPDNPDLIWSEASEVLVVTWTDWDGYDERVGSPFNLERPVWVTPAPQVQNFCQGLNFDPPSLTLRLEQYLGLPPHNGKTQFVELWVSPDDLWRPCPDPEIDDRSCQLQFPEEVSLEHKRSIVELMLSSYGANGYPWTRLGYTYDWGRVRSKVGASEFVIASGATVTVRSVQRTEEFCQGIPDL